MLFAVPQGTSGGGDGGDGGGGSNILSLVSGLLGSSSSVSTNVPVFLPAHPNFILFKNALRISAFRPKREEVMGEWRKLHNEEFRDLYSSPV
jgi:hypothetical protein